MATAVHESIDASLVIKHSFMCSFSSISALLPCFSIWFCIFGVLSTVHNILFLCFLMNRHCSLHSKLATYRNYRLSFENRKPLFKKEKKRQQVLNRIHCIIHSAFYLHQPFSIPSLLVVNFLKERRQESNVQMKCEVAFSSCFHSPASSTFCHPTVSVLG